MHGAGGVLFLQVLFLQCGVSFRVSNGEELPLRAKKEAISHQQVRSVLGPT